MKEQKQHLYSLDFLRGIAAYVVIFWHWKMFFYVNNTKPVIESNNLPFYDLFSIFYNHGLLAVEFFFCLSGFIFFYYFKSKIEIGDLSYKKFAVDRISRIYPLHIATFIIVAALQIISLHSSGYYLAFIYNDTYHAFLNIFMLHAWGFQSGFSYNAPSWSISIEIMLYLLFFIILTVKLNKPLLTIAMIILGAFLYPYSYNLSVGLFSFFSGGLLAISYEWISRRVSKSITLLASIVLLFSGVLILTFRSEFNPNWVAALLFIPVILTFTSISALRPLFLKKIKFFGDISFSIYLIHFPLMIITSILVNLLGVDKSLYLNEYFFIGFVMVLTLLGALSHYYFEMPLMKFIRNKLS